MTKSPKIKTLKELAKICVDLKKQGKTVGLITGCFDIVHLGHIDLFRFAKQKVDYLTVGVDSDETLTQSKGVDRPIFRCGERLSTLAEFESVDYLFMIPKIINFKQGANIYYEKLTRFLNPTALITTVESDKWWNEKKNRANKLRLKFYPFNQKTKSSTTKIVRRIKRML